MTLTPAQSASLDPPGSDVETGGGALGGSSLVTTVGVVAATTRGVLVSPGAANVKGAWTQLIAATAARSAGMVLQWQLVAAGDHLLDIGVGGAGAEVAIVSNLPGTAIGVANGNVQNVYRIPIAIPLGSRVSARMQNTAGATQDEVWPSLYTDGPAESAGSETVGAVTADSGGTSVDPGASVNTKGAWVELSAAIATDWDACTLCIGGQSNTARANAWWLIDIGVGGAGSEVVVASNIGLHASATPSNVLPQVIELPLAIAAGSRVSIRAQCNINDATDRTFDAVLVGFRA